MARSFFNRQLKDLGMVIEEGGVALALEEGRVGDDLLEETDIGLYTADAELLQGAVHGPRRIGKGQPQVEIFTSRES